MEDADVPVLAPQVTVHGGDHPRLHTQQPLDHGVASCLLSELPDHCIKRILTLLDSATGNRPRLLTRRRDVKGAQWRGRFVSHRLDGLHDEPRPRGPRTITDNDVERVIVKTLEEAPVGATHWSTRSMAKAAGMSPSTVSRIWRAFGLKPHLIESFTLSPDALFIDKVSDVVGLDLNPPDAALVLFGDEKW
jgi:Homeodomain-like domain